jgi:hypothetical protein
VLQRKIAIQTAGYKKPYQEHDYASLDYSDRFYSYQAQGCVILRQTISDRVERSIEQTI